MKFRKAIAIFSANLLVFMSSFAYAEEVQNEEIQKRDVVLRKIKHVYEDFEEYSGGNSNLGIYLALNGAKAVKGENPLLDGTSICMSFDDVDFNTTQKAEPFLYYTYPTSENFSWKADICADGKIASGGFVVVAKNASGGNVYLQNVNFSNGDIVINNLKTEGNRITLLPETKYTLEYNIDTKNKTFDFYVNDELVADDYKLQFDFASINQLRLITSANAESHDNVYLDNFTIYKFTDAENISPEISWDIEDEVDLNNVSEILVSAKDTDGDIKEIEFYSDGELIDYEEKANARFDISGIRKGKHIIKAIAYDNEGAKSEIEKTVNFVKDEVELINVTTNLLKDNYDISQVDKISISTSGNTSRIEKVMFYIDGKLVAKTSETEISLESVPTGKHEFKIVVFDGDMNKGTWKKEILFTENSDNTWYENDFSTYSGGNTVTGLVFNVTSGLLYECTSEMMDESYGNSIYFDVDDTNVTTENTDVGIWYNVNTDKTFKWGVSMCFDKIPENVHFQTVGPNEKGSNVYMSNVIIKNGEVTANGESVATIESGRFYDFEYIVDTENQKYSFLMNGEKLVDNKDFTSAIKSINTLRLVTSNKKGSSAGFSIDNVSVSESLMMPYILSCEKVDDKTVLLEMTNATNVEISDIAVSDSSGNIEIAEVSKEENKVFVTLKNIMRNDTKYTVCVTPSLLIDDTIQYGRIAESTFTTGQGRFGVSDVNFKMEDEKFISEIVLYNNTEDEKNALIILNIYKDNKIIDSTVKSVSVDTENTFEIESEMYDSSSVAKLFVLNSWQDRSAFCNNLFEY